jgi:hypothetical protein
LGVINETIYGTIIPAELPNVFDIPYKIPVYLPPKSLILIPNPEPPATPLFQYKRRKYFHVLVLYNFITIYSKPFPITKIITPI